MPDALDRAVAHARAWIAGHDTRSVAPTASYAELKRRIDVGLNDEGVAPEQVIDDLAAAVEGGLLGSPSARFFAWVIGGSVDSALAADVLTTAWDQNQGIYVCGPAASVVEETAGAWLKDLFDLPREASFAFVTGCQMAHGVGLAAARHGLLTRAGWDVETHGLFGAPRLRILTSDRAHGTLDRAARLLGFGTAAIQKLPSDADNRLPAAALERALKADDAPAVVALNAGDLITGAFDDFETQIPIAHAHGAWVHVDGAFGLFARASAAKRPLAAGIDNADSWATDMHKWMNVPYDSGVAFVKDAAAHRGAMSATAAYLSVAEEGRDALDWNPEHSRRARAITVYAALRELGRDGVEDLVDRSCRFCRDIVRGIGALDGAEALNDPQLNMGIVRFLSPKPGATDADHDAVTDRVAAAINASGEAYFFNTTWNGRRAMRVAVVNWRTTEDDVTRTVAAAKKALAEVREGVAA